MSLDLVCSNSGSKQENLGDQVVAVVSRLKRPHRERSAAKELEMRDVALRLAHAVARRLRLQTVVAKNDRGTVLRFRSLCGVRHITGLPRFKQ